LHIAEVMCHFLSIWADICRSKRPRHIASSITIRIVNSLLAAYLGAKRKRKLWAMFSLV